MKKAILIALAVVFAGAMNAQVLYSISGNGLKKKSYIVGTHHLADAKFANEIPGMAKVMKEIKQVYGELKMQDMQNADTVKMMQEAMMLPDKMTIKDVLDPEHFERLNNLFVEISGVPFDYPQIFDQMGRMKPSALETQLTVLMYISEHPMAFDPTKAIDSYFQNEALASKKEAHGLESYQYQIELMYKSQPIEEEVKSFICFLDNVDMVKKQLNILTDAYKAQNVTEIENAMYMSKEIECSNNEEAMDKIVYERNRNWVAMMPAIMKTKPTLFAVGAGHLFGEQGVLEMLRKAGYKIEAVK